MNRITTIDVTRGLVMVIMALDHVRDLLHTTAISQNPTDLATTTPAVFLTRWITHLCAPTFVFLSGTSAYLSLRKRNTSDARRFLLKRGIVLIVLELTIINFAFWFDLQFRSILIQVIYAIGAGLIVLSFLARLSARQIGVIGLVMIITHDLLLQVPPFTNQAARFGWALLFNRDFFQFGPNFGLFVAYPLVPWLGIMLAGFGCGQLMGQPASQRKRTLLRLGLGSLALFIVLRFINAYGDATPWSVQKDAVFTFLSFINVSKYPPSLQYSLLMLGIALLILSFADGANNTFTRVMMVYGTVPMFYYILHWYLVHLAMIGMVLLQGYALSDIKPGILDFGRPQGAGIPLEQVYAVWLGLVAFLYPLCKWYGPYKAAHPENRILRYV